MYYSNWTRLTAAFEMQMINSNPIPPDGGWGWVVVIASLMCNVIGDGTTYSFGVSLPKLVSHFEEGKGKVAWMGSLLSGVQLASGPIASVLINKYGCRVTCITGSIIAMSSFALSALSNSLIILMILYGICGGIGLGLIFLPTVVCVGQYFDKRRAIATGITLCGSGIGSFVMAPLAAFLLDRYDWRGTYLILAGIVSSCTVFGFLLRPLDLPKNQESNHKGEDNLGCDIIVQDNQDLNKVANVNEVKTDEKVIVSVSENNSEKTMKMPLINFSLMKNPVFLLIVLSYMIGYLSLLIPYVYIIDVAMTTGIEYEMASFLVSVIGITNTLGRLLSGFISNLPAVDPLTVIYISTGICGVTSFCVPFCSNYNEFVAITAIYGLFTSPFITLRSIVLVELLGISQLVDALGLLLLMTGIAAIVGSPLAGMLFDWTQSYKWTFWMAGSLLFISSILFATTYCVWVYLKRKEQSTNKDISVEL